MASGFFTTSATWEAPHLMVSRLEKGMAIYSAAAKSFQSCLTLCKPIDSSPPGSPVPGFSRQEHWSGLPFPSPMHESESESEVAQSCPTLCDPMDCSLPGSTVHGIFQARVLEWAAISFSRQLTLVFFFLNKVFTEFVTILFCFFF